LRGAVFEDEGTRLVPDRSGLSIADQALDDVARWLGFRSVTRYLTTLAKERSAIFKRATR
jgi:hypothetical protein